MLTQLLQWLTPSLSILSTMTQRFPLPRFPIVITHGSQAHPSEDYFLAHPEAPSPPLHPPCMDICYCSGRSDIKDIAAALIMGDIAPDFKPSSDVQD